MTDIKGLILAGGQSSRMGFDKSLKFREEIYRVMREVFSEVAFSLRLEQSQDEFYRDKTVVVDEILEGPMSGIYTSLRDLGSSVFVVACDMPFIKEATVYQADGFIQPLFALYEYSLFEPLRETLEDKSSGQGLNKFLKSRDIFCLEKENEIQGSFTNVNTPEDLDTLIVERSKF